MAKKRKLMRHPRRIRLKASVSLHRESRTDRGKKQPRNRRKKESPTVPAANAGILLTSREKAPASNRLDRETKINSRNSDNPVPKVNQETPLGRGDNRMHQDNRALPNPGSRVRRREIR